MASSIKIREIRTALAARMGGYLLGVIQATQRGACGGGEARAASVWL